MAENVGGSHVEPHRGAQISVCGSWPSDSAALMYWHTPADAVSSGKTDGSDGCLLTLWGEISTYPLVVSLKEIGSAQESNMLSNPFFRLERLVTTFNNTLSLCFTACHRGG